MTSRSEISPAMTARRERIDREFAYANIMSHVDSLQEGSSKMHAFRDWVDEQDALANYLQAEANLERTMLSPPEGAGRARVIFSRLSNRIDPQYALDRSVVRQERRRLATVQKKIKGNPHFEYHMEINFLQGRYGWSLYEAEKKRLELTRSSKEDQNRHGADLLLQARAHKNVASRLKHIRGVTEGVVKVY